MYSKLTFLSELESGSLLVHLLSDFPPGLYESAFTYASVLMRPEHRSSIDEKYRKKFEGIIRKRPKKDENGGREAEEPPQSTPCLYCSNAVPETDLYCPCCKNNLPYCIATGFHVTAADLSSWYENQNFFQQSAVIFFVAPTAASPAPALSSSACLRPGALAQCAAGQ